MHFANNIYRGACPQGFEDLLEMRDMDIGAWLHLESGVQRLLPGSWHYACQDWQVRLHQLYFYMPMWNFSFPSKDVLEYCAHKINAYREVGIYVCCKHGKDRTGVVLAYWRVVRCGWTPERAWKEAQFFGMHKFYRFLGWENKFYSLFKGEK